MSSPETTGLFETAYCMSDEAPKVEVQTASMRPVLRLPMLLVGIVVEGDHRGRELGFPTANVEVTDLVDSHEGVFAGSVRRGDGSLYLAAISVGRRETFYHAGAPNLVEAHLLDFSGDLYGECLQVDLRVMIRSQRRFLSVGDLVAEIESDVAHVRRSIDPSKRGPRSRNGGLGCMKVGAVADASALSAH